MKPLTTITGIALGALVSLSSPESASAAGFCLGVPSLVALHGTSNALMFRIKAEGTCGCAADANGFTYFQVDPPAPADEIGKLTFQSRTTQITSIALAGQKVQVWYPNNNATLYPQYCEADGFFVVGP